MSRAASMRREPKSTLIKVLAGVVTPDAGELTLFGESATFPLGAGESIAAACERVAFILAQNLYRRRRPLGRYDLNLDTKQALLDLAPIDRSLVAIVRAIAGGVEETQSTPRLLVLDEPSGCGFDGRPLPSGRSPRVVGKQSGHQARRPRGMSPCRPRRDWC